MKVLWLASWYPNELSPFHGDFIQRHARALAPFADVHVIHVMSGGTSHAESTSRVHQVSEHILYTRQRHSWAGRLYNRYRNRRYYHRAVRKYIREHGLPDLVHVQVLMNAGINALWLKKKYGIPYVITEHWGIYNEVLADRYSKKSRLFKLLTREIVLHASGFLSVSRFIADAINQLVAPKQFTVIPNVVDTSLFYYQPTRHVNFRFIHVSGMEPVKNVAGIIRAFTEAKKVNKDMELHLVGNAGAGLRGMMSEPDAAGSGIFFHGEIPYAEVARQMQQADAFILFSHIENSPCVIGEALCCGLPVIATKTGGVPELLNADNSLLVSPANEKELTEAMLQMVQHADTYDRQQLAESARHIFSYPVVGKKIIDFYNSIVPHKEKKATP